MVMKLEGYWGKRLELLEAIDKYGDRLPFSVLSGDIFAYGSSLRKVRSELENSGFIIAEKHSRVVKTCLTARGKKLVKILKELRGIVDED